MNLLRTIRWRLIISSLLAICLPLIILGGVMADLLWGFYVQQLQRELKGKALIVADAAGPVLSPKTPDDPNTLSRMVTKWQEYSYVRVTVANARGIIVASITPGEIGQQTTENRKPGLLAALGGRENSTTWKNPEYGNQDTMYVNVPVVYDGERVGAVRVAYTLTQIQNNIARIQGTLATGLAVYVIVIILLTVRLAASIVQPVEELNRGAERLAAGDLEHRVRVQGTDELVNLANTTNQMAARLQQLEGLRRQYVSNVSHELRTPLAAIRGMAETMMQYSATDPSLPERYLPRIIAQTERLARLASQLLDLAQIESGNLVTSFARVSVPAVVEEARQAAAEGAREKGVLLEVTLPPTLPDVRGDRDRLVQVFLNLMDNAVRHTPTGGRVTVSADTEGDRLVATVEDTGEGIPEEHLEHIFERFYRVEQARTRRSGGTGLGLSIVWQIMQAHGGSIDVTSAPGEGTCFTLTLPALPADAPSAPLADASPAS